MSSPHGDGWTPTPELLAAYFDGEFEGRDELAPLRQRLEAWLATNAEGRAQHTEHRRLGRLWAQTSAPEPAPAAWHLVQARLENVQQDLARRNDQVSAILPDARRTRKRSWRAARVVLAAACVLLSLLVLKDVEKPAGQGLVLDEEPFPVATEREVVILHVEGADTGAVVVGALPLRGPLELAGPGDVTLTSAQPDERDNMVPEIHISSSGRPFIWARAEADEE